MQEPRFVASSVEELVELARRADPPVAMGETAELALPRRRVRVVVREIDPLVVWDEDEEGGCP